MPVTGDKSTVADVQAVHAARPVADVTVLKSSIEEGRAAARSRAP